MNGFSAFMTQKSPRQGHGLPAEALAKTGGQGWIDCPSGTLTPLRFGSTHRPFGLAPSPLVQIQP